MGVAEPVRKKRFQAPAVMERSADLAPAPEVVAEPAQREPAAPGLLAAPA
jgi:hypothetical protein